MNVMSVTHKFIYLSIGFWQRGDQRSVNVKVLALTISFITVLINSTLQFSKITTVFQSMLRLRVWIYFSKLRNGFLYLICHFQILGQHFTLHNSQLCPLNAEMKNRGIWFGIVWSEVSCLPQCLCAWCQYLAEVTVSSTRCWYILLVRHTLHLPEKHKKKLLF